MNIEHTELKIYNVELHENTVVHDIYSSSLALDLYDITTAQFSRIDW